MLTSNSIWFGTIHSYRTLHKQAYLILWVMGPEMSCVRCSMLVYHSMITWSTKNRRIFNHISMHFQSYFPVNYISLYFQSYIPVNYMSTTVVSQSTLYQWLSNTLAISPGNPKINAYSIIKITMDQCCSNVVAININNIRFHRYGNGDSTFILHWNFNINHNDYSDGKSIFIQCWLSVWYTSLCCNLSFPGATSSFWASWQFTDIWWFLGLVWVGAGQDINLVIEITSSGIKVVIILW